MFFLFPRLTRWIAGPKPEDPPPVDKTPRRLTEQDLIAFQSASLHRSGMASYQEMLFVMQRYRKSDWVRIRRMINDLKWLSGKARELGIVWTDLDP